MSNETEPRVWVGCLACYNEGHLVGEWLDVDKLEEFCDLDTAAGLAMIGCKSGTATYPHEETWVFDHEGFGDLVPGECSPCTALKVMRWLEEVRDDCNGNEDEIAGVIAYVSDRYSDPLDCPLSEVRDNFRGIWWNDREFAQDFMEEAGDELPDWVQCHVDWDGVARDVMMDFSAYDVPSGGRAYFWN